MSCRLIRLETSKTINRNPRLNTEFDDNWYLHVATENGEMFGCSVPWHPKYFSKSKKKIDICRDSEAGKSAFKPDIKVE